MSEIQTTTPAGAIVGFEPEDARAAATAFDAAASVAARRGHLDEACDYFDRAIAIQRAFVLWWDAQDTHGGDRRSAEFQGNGSVTLKRPQLPADLDKMTVSRWRGKLVVPGAPDDPALFEAFIDRGHANLMRLANGGKVGGAHQANNSGENEWYTPAGYVESARLVLGAIDLDPASSEKANETVKAAEYYSQQRSGLEHPWAGRVWMNPPYAQPLIGQFIERLSEFYSEGEVDSAIVLVNNATDSRWGQILLGVTRAVCFPAGRIRFVDKHGNPSESPLQGQMFCYLGDDLDKFVGEFSQYGVCLLR